MVIDQQRVNSSSRQASGGKRGDKKTRMLRDDAYQANTIEFWNSCDAIRRPEVVVDRGSLSEARASPSHQLGKPRLCCPATVNF